MGITEADVMLASKVLSTVSGASRGGYAAAASKKVAQGLVKWREVLTTLHPNEGPIIPLQKSRLESESTRVPSGKSDLKPTFDPLPLKTEEHPGERTPDPFFPSGENCSKMMILPWSSPVTSVIRKDTPREIDRVGAPRKALLPKSLVNTTIRKPPRFSLPPDRPPHPPKTGKPVRRASPISNTPPIRVARSTTPTSKLSVVERPTLPSRRNEPDERQEMILWSSSLNQLLPSSPDKPTKPAREVTKKPTSKPPDADSKPDSGARLVKMADTVTAGIAPAKPPYNFDTPFGLEAGPSEGTGKGKDPVTKKTTARPTAAVESEGETVTRGLSKGQLRREAYLLMTMIKMNAVTTPLIRLTDKVAASAILAMASRPEMAKAQKYATEALAKPDGPQTTNEQMTEFLENFRVATMAYLSEDEMSEEEGTGDQDRTLMRQALATTKELREEVQRLTALVGGLRPSSSGLNLGTAVPLRHANAGAGGQVVGAPILPTDFTRHPTSHVLRQSQEKTTRDNSSSSSEADDSEYDRIRKPDDPMYQKYYLRGGTRGYYDEEEEEDRHSVHGFSDHRHKHKRSSDRERRHRRRRSSPERSRHRASGRDRAERRGDRHRRDPSSDSNTSSSEPSDSDSSEPRERYHHNRRRRSDKRHSSPGRYHRTLKPDQIGSFEPGKQQPAQFIRRVRQMARLYGKRNVLELLPLCLKGGAASWHSGLPTRTQDRMVESITEFADQLMARYAPDMFTSEDIAAKLKFHFDGPKAMDIRDYVSEKVSLLADANITKQDEVVKRIWKGLDPELGVFVPILPAGNKLAPFERELYRLEPTARKYHEQQRRKGPWEKARRDTKASAPEEAEKKTDRKLEKKLETQTTPPKRTPPRPCRHCGGDHWDDKCTNRKKVTFNAYPDPAWTSTDEKEYQANQTHALNEEESDTDSENESLSH
ncbi:hypothetical protein DFH27DRAFT_623114 [Peziza echinospora]|nr:hypothetical protein DFH27DRAFT_623114 [Peziza echinospora]